MRKNGKIVKCAFCGKEIYKSNYLLKLRSVFYCSRNCANKSQQVPINFTIENEYIKFSLFDKNLKEYICYIDLEFKHLLSRSWFICFQNKNKSFNIVDNKRNKLHRIITDCPKGLVVDHINGNTLDNRKCNLRICTIQENNQNKFKTLSNTGFRGVHYDKLKNMYIAYVSVKNKRYSKHFPFSEIGLKQAIEFSKYLRAKYLPFSII